MHTSPKHKTSDEHINTAVQILQNSGVIAIPTDTLYGLAASAFDEAAVAKVFRLKARPEGMALPLLLADPEHARMCAASIPPIMWQLADSFWPGALTIILPKSHLIPDAVTAGRSTVALRVPDHPLPRAIARALDAPITGTSANRSGRPGITTAQAVRQEFGEEIDYILDGGDSPGGTASTILGLSGGIPTILRQGAVSQQALEAVCKNIKTHT